MQKGVCRKCEKAATCGNAARREYAECRKAVQVVQGRGKAKCEKGPSGPDGTGEVQEGEKGGPRRGCEGEGEDGPERGPKGPDVAGEGEGEGVSKRSERLRGVGFEGESHCEGEEGGPIERP